MRAIHMAVIGLFVALLACACGEPPRVLQGTVVEYDSASKTVTVADELGQHEQRLFSLKEAEMGAVPEKGDEVRLAYHEREGRLVATRLMNLTRQQEFRGGSSKTH